MRKTKLFISMSLDGYIADENGGIDWLAGTNTEIDNSYDTFYADVDTVILGSQTYHQITTELSPDIYPYLDSHTYVFTHQSNPNTASVTFVKGDVVTLVDTLKQEEGKTIWIVGGSSIAKPLIEANAIDAYIIAIIPIILGKGIPLFTEMTINPIRLNLKETYSKNEMVYLHYTKK